MLSSVEQAFLGRDAPLKTPAWEAKKSTVHSL